VVTVPPVPLTTELASSISVYQTPIIDAVEKYGYVNILQAATICSITKQNIKGKDKLILWKFEPVQDIGSPSGLYRMIRSLENRGLVARLLHRRMAVWIKIIWKDGKPQPADFEQSDVMYVIERDGQIRFRTKGETWELKFPNPPANQQRYRNRQNKWSRQRWLRG
jgi:hypothetical protein